MNKNLDILLLSMPIKTIDRPSLSLPTLTAYLRKNKLTTEQRDINMEWQDILLQEKQLQLLYSETIPMLLLCNRNDSKTYTKLKSFYQDLNFINDNYGFKRLENVKRMMQRREYTALTDREVIELTEAIFKLSAHFHFYFTTVAYYFDFYHHASINESITQQVENLIRDIREFNPMIVGFSVIEVQRTFSLWFAQLLRQVYEGKILFGGSDLVLNNEKYLYEHKNIDFVCWADGEETLYELITELKAGRSNFDSIPNLMFRKHGKVIETNYKALPINEFHYAEYDGFPLDLYLFPSLQILTSKGCEWSKCKFCMHWNSYGQDFRQRAPGAVAEEMQYYKQKYGTSLFSIVDEEISADFGIQLSDEILKRDLHVRWIQMSRLDSSFNEDTFQILHTAGCRLIEWGLESGSQDVLDDMNKGINVKDAQRIIHQASESGIINKMLMFHNYPVESIEDLMASINIIRKNAYHYQVKPMLTLRHSFVLKMGSPLSEIAFNEQEEKKKYFSKIWLPDSIFNVNAQYRAANNNNIPIKENLVQAYLQEMTSFLKNNNVFVSDNNNITMDLVLIDLIEKGYKLPVNVFLPGTSESRKEE